MQGESIVIRHARQPNLLDTLLEGVNDSNLHGETGTGSSIGREEW